MKTLKHLKHKITPMVDEKWEPDIVMRMIHKLANIYIAKVNDKRLQWNHISLIINCKWDKL